jgi:2-aminoadipate transaminase
MASEATLNARYEAHLSRVGRTVRASAIRQAGDLGAGIPDFISLAPGFPDASLFPWTEIRDIAAAALDGRDPTVLQYGQTRGYRPLLDALIQVLDARGIVSRVEELVVTTGSQQGLDLCARVLLDPGDVVLVERPAYTGGLTAFGNAQARLVAVSQDAEGVSLSELERAIAGERRAGHRVAALYIVPNFQNPTGLLTSRTRRLQLLEWAARREVLIVEDDPYGSLYFDDAASEADTRPLKADDREGWVIYLSSFSKTAAPGFRVAWIAGPEPIVNRLAIAKQSVDLCTGTLDQRVIFEIWKRGIIDRSVPRLRQAYALKRTAIEKALARELGDLVSWGSPRGGFFLWAAFPASIDVESLNRRCASKGVLYVPGSAFHVDARASQHARLAFSSHAVERLDVAIARLAEAVRETLSDPATGPGPASGSAAARGAPSAARSSG